MLVILNTIPIPSFRLSNIDIILLPSFSTNIQLHSMLMLKDLYQEGRYTYITPFSDDQTQFKAHKIVLNACSPVKEISDSVELLSEEAEETVGITLNLLLARSSL